jgi:hypothetical protein
MGPSLSLCRRSRFDLTHHNGEMRERLHDACRTATSARREALHDQRLANMRLGNDQIVDVEFVIVFRVRDRRLQALANVLRDALARKFQIGERGRDLLAADQARDEIELLRADPERPGDRLGLVVSEPSLVRFLAQR